MRFDVVTLFPEMFGAVTASGITRRALEEGRWSLTTWNPRDFTSDNYRTIDDRPYGGGPGMVMLAEPLEAAVAAAKASRRAGRDGGEAGRQRVDDAAASGEPASTTDVEAPVLLMSPQGRPLTHRRVMELQEAGHGAVIVCGRYEAVDERFVERVVDEEVSLGDFVLSGGEIAAMALIDAVVRQLPGALGAGSAAEDSFAGVESGALLDCPHYTRPESWRGMAVPDVLLSGHHARIVAWRRAQAVEATQRKRPDLVEAARREGWLSRQDEVVLAAMSDPADAGLQDVSQRSNDRRGTGGLLVEAGQSKRS